MKTQITNNSGNVRNTIILIITIFTAFFIAFIGSTIKRPNEPPISIGRGGRVIIIRLPDPNKEHQKDVTFYESFSQMQLPESVELIPTYWREMKEYPITTRDLTANEWSKVERLIQSWCLHPPHFPLAITGKSNYTVAIQCNSRTEQFKVPLTEAPTELTDVLQLTPVADDTNTKVIPNISR